jgi:hypothetical protein
MRRLLTLAAIVALAPATVASTAQAQAPTGAAGRTFTIPLEGPGGTGTAVVTLNPGLQLVCYTIDVELTTEGDVPAEPAPGLGSAHIHVLPSGAIVVDLETSFVPTGDGGFTASGCVSADRETIIAILTNPESYYVNVHTVAFPSGAVTGTFA